MTQQIEISRSSGAPIRFGGAGRELLFILLLAAATRLYHLDHRGLWTDEFKTLNVIAQPIGGLVRECMAQSHSPAYFLILKAWVAVAGDGPIALRLPSAMASVAAAGFVFLAALRGWGRRAALFAALLFVMNQRTIWAAQEARPYPFAMLAGAGAFWALLGAVRDGGARRWTAFALWSLAGILFHPLYVLVIFGEGAVVAASLAFARRWKWRWTVAALAGAAMVIALYLFFARPSSNVNIFDQRGWPSGETILDGFAEILFGDFDEAYGSSMRHVFIALTLACFPLAWLGSRRRAGEGGISARDSAGRATAFWLAAAWAFSIYSGFILVSGLYRSLPENTRYFSLGAGGAALLAGVAISQIRIARLRWPALLALLALQAPPCVAWHRSIGDGVREAVAIVAKERKLEEPVFMCHDSEAQIIARYYKLGVEPIGVPRTAVDLDAVAGMVAAHAEGKPGFWVILYKERHSPLVDAAESWGKERGIERAGKWKLEETRVYHFAAK